LTAKNIDWIDGRQEKKNIKPMNRYNQSKIKIFFTDDRYYWSNFQNFLTDASIPLMKSMTDSID
jgi:hypothetical protein